MRMQREPVGIYPPKAAAATLGLAIDVKRDYGASGSDQSTTGTIPSGSKTLTLAAAIDFVDGQGISIANAGPLPTISAPTAATATAEGTTGTTTIDYAVAALDGSGGVTASLTFSVTDANATLSATNYVALAVTAVTNAVAYVWWRTSAPGTSPTTTGVIGVTTGTTLDDTGLATFTPPTGIPTTAPSTAIGGPLVTTIGSGAGTTTLTLAAAASNAVSSVDVYHDDTAAFNAATAAGGLIYVPAGTYNISGTVSLAKVGTVLQGESQTTNWFTGGTCVLQAPYYLTGAMLSCTANWTTISGLTLSSISEGQAEPAVQTTAMGNSLYRLLISNLGGIYCNGASRAVLEDVVLQAYSGPYGFHLENASAIFLFRCVTEPAGNNPSPVSYYLNGGGSMALYSCASNGTPTYALMVDGGQDNEFFDFEGNGATDAQVYVKGANEQYFTRLIAQQGSPTAVQIDDSYMVQLIGCLLDFGTNAGSNPVVSINQVSGSCFQIAITGCQINQGGTEDGNAIKTSGNTTDLIVVGNVFNYNNAAPGTTTPAIHLDGGIPQHAAIVGNDAIGYPTFIDLASGTAGTDPSVQVVGNAGYNPVGALAAPAIPGSGITYTNAFGVACTVYVSGGTVSEIAVAGTSTGLTSGAVRVAAGQTITLTYTAAPTWTWFGD